MALDFISSLPVSDGNSVILVVVDRFSKALPKLPSARETAHVLRQHVSLLMLFLIEDPSLLHGSGSLSAGNWGRLLACRRGFTLRLTGKLSRLISPWKTRFVARWLTIQHLGAGSSRGQNMHSNFLQNASAGPSPFEAQMGYQPPLFPELEKDTEVPC